MPKGNEKAVLKDVNLHDSKTFPSGAAPANATAAAGTAMVASDTKSSLPSGADSKTVVAVSATATEQKVSAPSNEDDNFIPAYELQALIYNKDTTEQFRNQFESIIRYRKNHPLKAKIFYFFEPGTNFEKDILGLINTAIEHGRTDILEIMRDDVIKFPYALHRAVFYQQLNVVQWIFLKVSSSTIKENCDKADPTFVHRRKFITLARNVLGIAVSQSDTAHRSAGNKEIVATICSRIPPTYFSCEIGVLRLAIDFPEIIVQLLNYFPKGKIEEFIIKDFDMSLCRILQEYSAEDMDKIFSSVDPFILARGIKGRSVMPLLNNNKKLTLEQKEIAQTYLNAIVMVTSEEVSNPKKYVQALLALIPNELEKIIKHDQWIELINNGLKKIKGNNLDSDYARDNLYALLGRIYLSKYYGAEKENFAFLTSAQLAWYNISNAQHLACADDNFQVTAYFLAHPDRQIQKKALQHSLAAAIAGNLDGQQLLTRAAVGLSSVPTTDQKRAIVDAKYDSAMSLELDDDALPPLSKLNDGVTSVCLFSGAAAPSRAEIDRYTALHDSKESALDQLTADELSELEGSSAQFQELTDIQQIYTKPIAAAAAAPKPSQFADSKHSGASVEGAFVTPTAAAGTLVASMQKSGLKLQKSADEQVVDLTLGSSSTAAASAQPLYRTGP